MRVLLFGATGMIGQGVLRECLLAPDVELVQTIGRMPTGVTHPKIREIVHADLADLRSIEKDLAGFDACFFCLGVSSAGLSEAEYTRVTYDMTLMVAETLVRLDPGMTFVYISGAGADSSEHGRVMWARVKGRTENSLLSLPFHGVYVVRPGFVEPLHGVTSRTAWYRLFYAITAPLLPALRRMFPAWVLTTEDIGKAMLELAPRSARARPREQGRPCPAPFRGGVRLAFDERFQSAQRVVPVRGDQIKVFLYVPDRFRIKFEQAFTPRMRVSHDSRRFKDSQVFGDRLPGKTSTFGELRYGISLSVRQP